MLANAGQVSWTFTSVSVRFKLLKAFNASISNTPSVSSHSYMLEGMDGCLTTVLLPSTQLMCPHCFLDICTYDGKNGYANFLIETSPILIGCTPGHLSMATNLLPVSGLNGSGSTREEQILLAVNASAAHSSDDTPWNE